MVTQTPLNIINVFPSEASYESNKGSLGANEISLVSGVGVILASYTSGTSWYRKWSDGWIEQGGEGVASGYPSNAHVNNFVTPFSNTNYTIVCTKLNSGTSAAIAVGRKTTTTFKMSCQGQGGSGFSAASDITWYACGY